MAVFPGSAAIGLIATRFCFGIEGRSWTGLHRHALMTCIAFAYLQHRRLKAAGRGKKATPQRTAAAAIAA
jgi:SRSO17 transposase